MAECSDGSAAQEGKHIRHKELQSNWFAPNHLQSDFTILLQWILQTLDFHQSQE